MDPKFCLTHELANIKYQHMMTKKYIGDLSRGPSMIFKGVPPWEGLLYARVGEYFYSKNNVIIAIYSFFLWLV